MIGTQVAQAPSMRSYAYAEHLHGTMYKLIWPCAHYRTFDLTRQSPRHRGIGAGGARFLLSWWSKDKGGVWAGPCPTCGNRRKPGPIGEGRQP